MNAVAAMGALADSFPFDVERVRADFPILGQIVRGTPLVYLDSAATAQKPAVVIDAEAEFYRRDYANVRRGVHALSERATAAYEGARERVRRFINARDRREVVFVRGTTEAINLVATAFGRSQLGEGDEVILTELEHHANIVPWQMLCRETGARIRVAPIDDSGDVRFEEYLRLFSDRTRLVSIAHVSNALGTVNPVKEMIAAAHARGVTVLVDGAQAVPHLRVDVQDLGCDFYAFSAHKMYGPSGIGVLYGKAGLLASMPPYQGGGEMVRQVTFEESVYAAPPDRFEAGTPNIAGAVGMGVAVEYLEALGRESVAAHEQDLIHYATERLGELSGVRIIGTAREKAGVVSFVVEGVHPHDIGTIMDNEGIAIRAGHHCAMPVMRRFGVAATARASFGLYNTRAEVDALVRGIHRVREVLKL